MAYDIREAAPEWSKWRAQAVRRILHGLGHETGIVRDIFSLLFCAAPYGGSSMSKLALLAIMIAAAGVASHASARQASSETYPSTGYHAVVFDTGRCFNRCIAYRGLRPSSMRIAYCSRRCHPG